MAQISENWIKDRVKLHEEQLDEVRSLSLPGTYHEKIAHLADSLKHFSRLKELDLSRNALESLEGLQHLQCLESLNLYYNNITTLQEVFRLSSNCRLQILDLRLNPVARNEPDYRLFVIHMLPSLRRLDDRSVRDGERKASLMHFGTDQGPEFTQKVVNDTRLQKSKPVVIPRAAVISRYQSTPLQDVDDVVLMDSMRLRSDVDTFNAGVGSEMYPRQELLTEVRRESARNGEVIEEIPGRQRIQKVNGRRRKKESCSNLSCLNPNKMQTSHFESVVKSTPARVLSFTPSPKKKLEDIEVEEQEEEGFPEDPGLPGPGNCPILNQICELVDKYWCSKGSLIANKHFQAHAQSLLRDSFAWQQEETGERNSMDDAEMENLRLENERLKLEIRKLQNLQELSEMLKQSHGALIDSNAQLTKELSELRSQHSTEIRQLRWSYQQLKSTYDGSNQLFSNGNV